MKYNRTELILLNKIAFERYRGIELSISTNLIIQYTINIGRRIMGKGNEKYIHLLNNIPTED